MLPPDTEPVRYIKFRSIAPQRVPRPADPPPRRASSCRTASTASPIAATRSASTSAATAPGSRGSPGWPRERRSATSGRRTARPGCSSSSSTAPGRGRPVPGQFGEPRPLRRRRHQELIPEIERRFRGIGRARPASSTAARPAAGCPWRSRSSIRTSGPAPGRSAPTGWIFGRSSSSTSTRIKCLRQPARLRTPRRPGRLRRGPLHDAARVPARERPGPR